MISASQILELRLNAGFVETSDHIHQAIPYCFINSRFKLPHGVILFMFERNEACIESVNLSLLGMLLFLKLLLALYDLQ